MLRRLRRLAPAHDYLFTAIRSKSLEFLESCATDPPGAFAFWPLANRPAWAPLLGPDADDTAVITLELLVHGRRTRSEAFDALVDILLACLTGPPAGLGPPWLRAGVFPTWLGFDGVERANIIDCAVNANVLALMSMLDSDDLPGFAAAHAMIEAAVAWCSQGGPAGSRSRADTIAPYYACPQAVVEVLDDAVWSGVSGLSATRDHLAQLIGPPTNDGPLPLWRNAYGGPVWSCPAWDLTQSGASAQR